MEMAAWMPEFQGHAESRADYYITAIGYTRGNAEKIEFCPYSRSIDITIATYYCGQSDYDHDHEFMPMDLLWSTPAEFKEQIQTIKQDRENAAKLKKQEEARKKQEAKVEAKKKKLENELAEYARLKEKYGE